MCSPPCRLKAPHGSWEQAFWGKTHVEGDKEPVLLTKWRLLAPRPSPAAKPGCSWLFWAGAWACHLPQVFV